FEWRRGCAREWLPQLADLSFPHAWGGYLGVPRDWLPTVNFDKTSRAATLYGYAGRGVSTSALRRDRGEISVSETMFRRNSSRERFSSPHVSRCRVDADNIYLLS